MITMNHFFKRTLTISFFLSSCSLILYAQQPVIVPLKWLSTVPVKPAGVSWGLPWAQGLVKNTTGFALVKTDGSSVAVQSWPMAWWPDGSVKWTGFATVADSSVKNSSIKLVPDKSKQPVNGNTIQ